MTVNPAAAASAYTNAAQLGSKTTPGSQTTNPLAENPNAFSDMVQQAVDSVSQSGQAAETKAAELATGNADIVDLVTAVAETELALETLVSVRDRVITAYQEILNMPI